MQNRVLNISLNFISKIEKITSFTGVNAYYDIKASKEEKMYVMSCHLKDVKPYILTFFDGIEIHVQATHIKRFFFFNYYIVVCVCYMNLD